MNWFKRLFASKPPEAVTRDQYVAVQEESDSPWAMFEIDGFEDTGRIKVKFSWNQSFIDELDKLGFTAESQEDTVQLFFYTAQMKPMQLLAGDETVQSDDLPNLSPNANRIVK